MPKKANIVEELRIELNRSSKSMYRLAKDSGIPFPVLHRIAKGQRTNMTAATLEQLAAAIGLRLELRPIRKAK